MHDRAFRIIQETIRLLRLDLSGLTVLTEVGSPYFIDEYDFQQINENSLITSNIAAQAYVSKVIKVFTAFICEYPLYAFLMIYKAYKKSNVKSLVKQIHPIMLTIGLAALATKNISSNEVWVGSPAKKFTKDEKA